MNAPNSSLVKKNLRSIFSLCGLAIGMLTFLNGCGTETGNPVIKRPTTPRAVAQDALESELAELSETFTDTGTESSQLAFSLATPSSAETTNADQHIGLAEHPRCSSTSEGPSVTFDKKSERTKQYKKAKRTLKISVERSQSIVWNSPLSGVTCSEDTGIQKRTRLLEGTVETRSGSFKKTLISSGKSSNLVYSNAEFSSTGKRITTFDKITFETETITTDKTLSWSVRRTNRVTTGEGESTDESTSVVSSATPIKISVVRSRGSGLALISRTIKSGEIATTKADGTKITLSYDDLNFGASDDCYPSSGVLRGTVTSVQNEAVQNETFEVDFSKIELEAEVPEIVFSGGSKIPLSGTCID